MPLIPSDYCPGWPMKNGHISTIYSAIVRKVKAPGFERERLELEDGDYLDLDWTHPRQLTGKVVILLHGLEGNAQRPYMIGSIRLLSQHGFSCCAVNFRGCSGTPNRHYASYHSGATKDLDAVVRHVISLPASEEVYLLGFSLGGNLLLKYLGEAWDSNRSIHAASAISVPCDLHDSLHQLNQSENVLYARRFLKSLKAKLEQKRAQFPERLHRDTIDGIRTLRDFDEVYTSQAHGFKDAGDYYTRSSCLPFLSALTTPTLLLNARNDSFLGPFCYPDALARTHEYLYLECPDFGGHVGFVWSGGTYYNELRTLEFFTSQIPAQK